MFKTWDNACLSTPSSVSLQGCISCGFQVAQWLTVTIGALMETLQQVSHAHLVTPSATRRITSKMYRENWFHPDPPCRYSLQGYLCRRSDRLPSSISLEQSIIISTIQTTTFLSQGVSCSPVWTIHMLYKLGWYKNQIRKGLKRELHLEQLSSRQQ